MNRPDSVLPDARDRDTARFVFDRNIIVEAGAGTGKTTLLIERLSFWLLSAPEADAAGVVALTFTEKAAAEIKTRLARHLARAAELFSGPREEMLKDRFCSELAGRLPQTALPAGCEAVAGRARAAIDALERAQIGTIHAFASHILRLFPVEAGIDPQAEVDAGEAETDFFNALWLNWLDTELGEHAPRPDCWKRALAKVGVEDLRALARELCRPDMAAYNPRAGAAACVALCREKARLARELAAKYPSNRPLKINDALLQSAAGFDAFARAFETGDFSASHPGPDCAKAPAQPKAWPDDDYALAKGVVEFALRATLDSHKVVLACVELLKPFAALYRERYGREQLLSFDELLVRARDLLKNNTAARTRLKAEYRTLLIDEFQDTDPLQGEMLLYLAEEDGQCAPSWRELKLKPGKLFVVGDPKQSIYRFRGADMKAYDMFTGHMTAQGAVLCRLKTNFRSTPALINAVNYFTGSVMKREENIQPEYVDINPPPGRVPGAPPEAVLVAAGEGETLGAEDGRERQFDLIARWIKNNAGTLELEPGRKMRLKDVAVLLRSASALGVLLDAFKRHGVGYVVEEKRFFYSTPEVTDLLNLLAVIDNPDDVIALAGLLRSPLAGLCDREIYELKCRGQMDCRVPAPVEKAERFFARLRTWRADDGVLPARRFIDKMLAESRAAELLATAYGGEQTALNVFKFAEIFARAAEQNGLGPGDFVRRAADYVAEKTGEGESPLADELLDAVNIMTMHKAKGLEFPVVVLPNIAGASGGGTDRPVRVADHTEGLAGLRAGSCADFVMAALEEREKLHSRAEEARIFYVALTRARDRLLLFGTDKRHVFRATFPQGSVAKLLETADENVFAGEGSPRLKVTRDVSVPLEGLSAGAGDFAARSAIDGAAWRAVNARRIERLAEIALRRQFISPTGLEKERDFAPAQEETPLRRELAVAAGNICHKTLELHTFGPGIAAAEVRAAAAYFSGEYPAGIVDSAAKNAAEILAAFSGSAAYRELASARVLGREVPFCYAQPDGVVMRGIMDLIAETDAGLTVYDYKSDSVAPGSEAARAAVYEEQKTAYLEIIHRLCPGQNAKFKLVFLRTGAIVPA